MAKPKEIVIRRKEHLVGLSEAAKRLGCSYSHLSLVIRGRRESRSLTEAMAKNNIRVAK